MSAQIPIGAWIRTTLPAAGDTPALEFIGFTYLDPQAGLSAKGGPVDDESSIERPSVTLRLPFGDLALQQLTDDQVRLLGLPAAPSWLEFFGPQPSRGSTSGAWREHPALRRRFHEQYPDDLQVIVHDGGPRISEHRPELVWVRIVGMDGDLFSGTVLNQPHQLTTVSQGQQIQFVAPASSEHALLVTPKYLAERDGWEIGACDRCGLNELLDAPSDLLRVVFPGAPPDAQFEAFSAFCMCGGVQLVKRRPPSS